MSGQDSNPKNLRVDLTTSAIESARRELMELALDIHAHPELNYQEYYAANLLSGTLERHGFTVERGIGGVETAFRGTLQGGSGDGPTAMTKSSSATRSPLNMSVGPITDTFLARIGCASPILGGDAKLGVSSSSNFLNIAMFSSASRLRNDAIYMIVKSTPDFLRRHLFRRVRQA